MPISMDEITTRGGMWPVENQDVTFQIFKVGLLYNVHQSNLFRGTSVELNFYKGT